MQVTEKCFSNENSVLPFIGGKAKKKNVCQKRTFLGEGGSGVGDVALTLL